MYFTRRGFLQSMSALAGIAAVSAKLPVIAAAAEKAKESLGASGGVKMSSPPAVTA
jgi:phosphodiesterase/alkaline phosphatase D-like protein